jgi:hypothetical protein
MRILLATMILGVSAAPALAHNLHVDCRVRGDKVFVEAFYDGDEPAEKALVKVMNGDKEIAAGSTDKKGKWSFATPAPGKYLVKVDGGAGHRAEQEFDVPAEKTVSPPREDRPDNLWLKVAIGLVVIAALSGAFLLASMLRRRVHTET